MLKMLMMIKNENGLKDPRDRRGLPQEASFVICAVYGVDGGMQTV